MTGSQLALLLGALSVSQQQLADWIGYSRSAVAAWVDRDQELPPEVVGPIVRALIQHYRETEQARKVALHILTLAS